ncbi:MAG: type II toxin-antitoxin system HicB family antitoxin [Deltaproteobacteria bacterium]|nr:type II toxin-antitoxin system HicB family antitoxin [Deltaproteobacteria bacterium]
MSGSAYRMLVLYEAESEKWKVTVPEIPGFAVLGATRSEVVQAAEEELERHIDQLRLSGMEVPPPVDEEDFGTELTIELSSSLHKELAFQARWEKCELPELIVQLLTEGLYRRRSGRAEHHTRQPRGEDRGRERDYSRRGRNSGNSARYQQVMYDGASFREYVRSIEPAGGRKGTKRRKGGGRSNSD